MPSPPSNPLPGRTGTPSGRIRRLALALGLAACCLSAGGCVKSIFRAGDPRTQYDRYDASRNQFEPDYVPDEYGRLEPNLRGRLLVKY
ncbi:MAG: hypothetical protein H6814_00765 [Phycisphaeraceae bacterium]|nr:hypothetical protein [Phycisphaeraceae bacterium]